MVEWEMLTAIGTMVLAVVSVYGVFRHFHMDGCPRDCGSVSSLGSSR